MQHAHVCGGNEEGGIARAVASGTPVVADAQWTVEVLGDALGVAADNCAKPGVDSGKDSDGGGDWSTRALPWLETEGFSWGDLLPQLGVEGQEKGQEDTIWAL